MQSIARIVVTAFTIALVAGSLLTTVAVAKDRRGLADPIFDKPVVIQPDEPDPCDAAEEALHGFLPETATLKKTTSFWAKLTVKDGVSVVQCNLGSGGFEVKFHNTTIKTYARPAGIGGWNHVASISCAIRVTFAVGFSPPSTVTLSNLNVVAVNCNNSPNWLDKTLVKKALNAIFPSSISFQI
jgi:hypothetical protein